MRSTILIPFAAASLLVGSLSSAVAKPVDGSARRAALAGGAEGLTGGAELIQDHADVFTFPQLTTRYRNLAHVSMGLDTGDGDGLLLFGSERFTIGVGLHSDRKLRLAGPSTAPDPSTGGFQGVSELHNMADLLLGINLEKGTIGAAFSLAFDKDSQTTSGASEGAAAVTQADSGYGFGLKVGYSQETWDVAIGLEMQDITSEAVDSTSRNAIGFEARGRGYIDWKEPVKLGWLAGLDIQNQGLRITSQDGAVKEHDRLGWGIFGAFGPVYNLKNRAEIGAYGLIHIGGTSGVQLEDPSSPLGACDSGEDCKTSTLILPGFQLGGEYWIEDWISLRAGAQYTMASASESVIAETVPPNKVTDRSRQDGSFGWSTGVGVKLEDFRFDGVLQDSWLTDGPLLLSQDSGLFAGVSASYRF
ncbi:MAG: hypothetical protein VYE15_03315 [Myxococcota bacterium]|nr:hypothetical protein [Myxococcota bacterium]